MTKRHRGEKVERLRLALPVVLSTVVQIGRAAGNGVVRFKWRNEFAGSEHLHGIFAVRTVGYALRQTLGARTQSWKILGQVVTIFISRKPCDKAGLGKLEAATAPTTAAPATVLLPVKKSRRFIFTSLFVFGRCLLIAFGQVTATNSGDEAMPVGLDGSSPPPKDEDIAIRRELATPLQSEFGTLQR